MPTITTDLSLLIAALDHPLRAAGFDRRRQAWNRRAGLFVDVIDVQASKSQRTAFVNLGVLDSEVYARTWSREPRAFIHEAECTVRSRLGVLASGRDVSWDPTLEDDRTQISAYLQHIGMPFFDGMHSRPAMIGHLEGQSVRAPADNLSLAVLHECEGNKQVACRLLTGPDFVGLGAEWMNRVRTLAAAFDC